MTLNDIKTYLRIDDDITEDDQNLLSMQEAGKAYIESATGKVYIENNKLMDLLLLLVISHWYTNRNNNGKTTSTKEYDHSISALLHTIKFNDSFEAVKP